MLFSSHKLHSFVADYEKFRAALYDDATGNATIGYGHLVHYGRVGTDKGKEKIFEKGITRAQAVELLKFDIRTKAEVFVNRHVKVNLTQNQFDALVSFTFNVGAANFSSSTLLKIINSGITDPVRISTCFKLWCKGKIDGEKVTLGGLLKRRQQEADIYNKNIYVSTH